MVEGSYRSWDLYTTGQLVDGLQQQKKKKENRLSLNGNGIMSFLLGLQFYVFIVSEKVHAVTSWRISP